LTRAECPTPLNITAVRFTPLRFFSFEHFVCNEGGIEPSAVNAKSRGTHPNTWPHCFKRMLEYWYKEKRTLVDFRRGPLGPYFDGLAAHLTAKGYSPSAGRHVLCKCCQFNDFLIEEGISSAKGLSESLVDSFLEACHAHIRATGSRYSPMDSARHALKYLFAYLVEVKAFTPPKPKRVVTPYTWLLDPYLHHLETERLLSGKTIAYHKEYLNSFLAGLGRKTERKGLKNLKPETIEDAASGFFRTSTANPATLSAVLRQFFRYCAIHRYTQADFSGLVPPIRTYRHATLPKGMEDSALETMLKAIKKDTPFGARDYAIVILLIAYGIRGISAAELLLEDIDWSHSRIRIRAQKGGKEVVVPLLDAVGEALIEYLRHRPAGTSSREVFLALKAPFRPLDGGAISAIVQRHLKKAGVKTPGSGSRTLRHSWAIRALAHNSAIKSIADVLGHLYIDTTFIYAKADLNSLREVAMPWPGKK
jgi:integrase/recombinase XerD